MKILKIISTLLLLANFVVGQQYIDKPFLQDFSEKYDFFW